MKRKATKRLALLIAAILLCAVCGCAPSESDNGDATTASTTSTTTSATTMPSAIVTKPTGESTTLPSDPSASSTDTTETSTTVGKKPSISTAKPTAKPTTASSTKTTASSKTSNSTSSSTTVTTTTTRKPITSVWEMKSHDVGFGYYGGPSTIEELRSLHVNTAFCDSPRSLETFASANVKVWYGVYHIYKLLLDGYDWWQEAFDSLWKHIQNTGYEDTVLGWYIDEPSDMPAVKEFTKYAYETYGKRFLICFMVNTVDPNVWGGFQGEDRHISKDTVQYLTDIALDLYWGVEGNEGMYEALYDTLHKMMRPDAKVWYIPTTHAGYGIVGQTDEEIRAAGEAKVTHLRYMYDWLIAEPPEHRGGILVFANEFDSPYEGIFGLHYVNEKTGGKWQFVKDECIRIGKEICLNKMPDEPSYKWF